MTFLSGRCPHGQSAQIVKRGKPGCGTQRYLGQSTTCATGSVLLDYRYQGRLPAVNHQIIAMSLNASGVRDTARVLRISTDTVFSEIRKKEAVLESVNTAFLRTCNPDDLAVAVERAGEAEMDERWSFVGNKDHPRWRWHAMDYHTGTVLASVFGRRKDAVFLPRKALLEPVGLTRFSTAQWGAYTRHLEPAGHRPGKRHTQKIARQHLPLRTRVTRVVRKTICFSQSTPMHAMVIGWFVNRSAFGLLVYSGHLHI
jgi:insertion element IS1 protein InsB